MNEHDKDYLVGRIINKGDERRRVLAFLKEWKHRMVNRPGDPLSMRTNQIQSIRAGDCAEYLVLNYDDLAYIIKGVSCSKSVDPRDEGVCIECGEPVKGHNW